MRKWKLCIAIILGLSGCGNEDSSQEVEEPKEHLEESLEDDRETEREETEDSKKKQQPTAFHPLTGEGTDEIFPNRPVAVTVNNAPTARPQSGLHLADVVYEVLAEGSTTRFLAIFQSEQPERIGPVRSVRPYFIDLANGYDSLLVTHGWSPTAHQMLTNGEAPYLNGLYYDGTLFKRSPDRPAPHDSYISYRDVIDGLKGKGYDIEGHVDPLSFASNTNESLTDGKEATDVTVSYFNYDVQYEFDEEKSRYLRSTEGIPSKDLETDERLQASNILIAEAPHEVIDDQSRRKIHLNTGGKALLLQNGKSKQIEWENRDGKVLPVEEGKVLPFVPGQTWIHIIPSSAGIEESVHVNGQSEEHDS